MCAVKAKTDIIGNQFFEHPTLTTVTRHSSQGQTADRVFLLFHPSKAVEDQLAKGFALDIPSNRTDAVEAFMAVVFWVFHYTGDRHERFLRAPQE